jgi:hypothetical protein
LSLEDQYFDEEPPEEESYDLEPGAEGDHPGEEDDAFNPFSLCEERFYLVQSQFVQDVEAWLEEKARARP